MKDPRIRLVCGLVCGGLFYVIDVGGPNPLWTVPLSQQMVLSCIRKLAKPETMSKPAVFLHDKQHKTSMTNSSSQLGWRGRGRAGSSVLI